MVLRPSEINICEALQQISPVLQVEHTRRWSYFKNVFLLIAYIVYVYDIPKKSIQSLYIVVMERAHRTGKKNKSRSRPIVTYFSFYKDKTNILKNCKNLWGLFQRQLWSSRKKCKKFLSIRKKGMISYLNYCTVISKQRVRQFFFLQLFFFLDT